MKPFGPALRQPFAVLVCLLAATTIAVGQPPSSDAIEVQDCFVRFAQKLDVPALETGRVDAVSVARNDPIKRGDPLAKLDDRTLLKQIRAAQVRLGSAKKAAEDEKEILYAEHAFKEANEELDASRSIQSEVHGAVPTSQVRRLRLAVERARLEKELAKGRQENAWADVEIREAELAVINDQLRNLHLESPIDGVVLNLHRSAGEWIRQGEPIATIARIDRLHVHGHLSSAEISPSRCRGLPVSVQWHDHSTGQERSLRGKVLSIDPQMLPDGRYILHAEIVNQTTENDPTQWLLSEGAEVRMKVYPSAAISTGPSRARSR